MKIKKLVGITLVAGMSLAIFTGCGGSSSSGSGKSDAKEITFWNPFTGADNSNLKKMIDEYNATNPEYKIKNVSLKDTDMYAKIPTVVNSGKNIPDLNIVHAERIKQYKDNEMLNTYDDLLGDHPELNADNYVAEAWNLGEIDGERYSLPLDIHNWGTFYNVELLEKYAPDALDDEILTIDEIMAAGEKAKADDVRGIAVSWAKPNFLGLLKQEGGELTEDGVTPTLDTEASAAAISEWTKMYEAGVTTKDGEDPTQLFLAGKLIFFPEGIWIQNNIKDAEFEWGLTNAPQLTDDLSKTVNWASSHQFVMFKNDDRSEEKTQGILDFIEWLRTNSLEWAKAGQNPATLDILNNEEYLEMPQSIFINTPEEQATLNIFDYKYNGYVAEYLDAHGFDTIFGKTSVEDFTSGMQKEVSDKVAKDNSN
ncbi:multiple sugar transport system substrate-binding protein [Enterococcus sp. PF1-24]|uniref:extracellular solute-binding protein n=1 Tax=unclassified Enterococcus TaxID=2608891 RepID=UPI002475C1CF|nr:MULTISPECIES: extracellular solute-binding protein [unclassified Enterococcus]MDH6365727.1 multiple sugar transport system substrate-binding protein [Enterococcus sp. PFB1-1]MDH6402832.1 multiple sugar transport system substrate-binding protein [Enterococcus sp. PF1-24]